MAKSTKDAHTPASLKESETIIADTEPVKGGKIAESEPVDFFSSSHNIDMAQQQQQQQKQPTPPNEGGGETGSSQAPPDLSKSNTRNP
ncbi:hypothetical protein BVRB_1g001990 [Beta vulgaris subsp. vulgaris]|nr:hypothetical protein BVRB_1g001990 [Beta vulgaris subsp. vulgaris]